ncbi:MAG: hypothetical protein ACE5LU_13535 [Anaerolineae bacterium]
MFHASHSLLRRGLLLAALLIFASAWLIAAIPVLAQGEETPQPSMTERFLNQPDLAAPLVVPMILALGGIVTLIAFLGWVFKRMPENSGA